MKKYLLLFLSVLVAALSAGEFPPRSEDWVPAPDRSWYTHYEEAIKAARRDGKLIYVLKTGSDWCGWCVKLKTDVFNSADFKQLQNEHFVFLYLDFPSRVNMPQSQKQHNTQVSKKLKISGGYPSAKLITPDGTELGRIGGYSPAKQYIKRLESFIRKKPASLKKSASRTKTENTPPARENSPAQPDAEILPDKGNYMSVISMGTSRNGEGLIFPQPLQIEVGEYIYFRVRCTLPEGRRARILITPPFGKSKTSNSRLGKNTCELVAAIAFVGPYQLRELELRLIPMDSNTPLEIRKIPVDLTWRSK